MGLDDNSPQASTYPGDNGSGEMPSTRTTNGNSYPFQNLFRLRVKPELVTRPDYFTLYFGFLGRANWEKRIAQQMRERAENAYVMAARLPTQDEMDVMVTYGSRSTYVSRIGAPIGSFAYAALLYRRARKHPLFPPNPTPTNLLTAARTFHAAHPGELARLVPVTLFKFTFAIMTGWILTTTFATWSDIANELTDPRTKQLWENMRHRKPEEIQQRKTQVATERVRMYRAGVGSQFERQVIEGLRGNASTVPSQDYNQDSYDSPASWDSSSSAQTSTPTDTDTTYSKQPTNARVPDASRRSRMYGSQPQAATQGMGNEVGLSGSGSDFFGDDDASPTAPEYRGTNIDGSAAGSAWDRIRRQAGTRPPPRQPGSGWGSPQNPSEPIAGSGAAGDRDRYDYDRKGEKEQAQSDFDRMLDAERNVPSDSSSRNRRWGS